MSCAVTKGRSEPCKDTLGGIRAVYFADFATADGAFTVTASEVTAIAAGLTTVFKYETLAEGNTFDQGIIGSRESGTRVNTQTLTLVLKKQDVLTHAQIDLIVAGRPVVIVRDNNSNYHVLGITEGMETTGSTVGTGGAKSDFNGYNLTLSAQENDIAPLMDAATKTALEVLVDASPIAP
jgi:hypothetical protein